MRNILFAALIALSASVANADLLSIKAVQPTVAAVPDGFTVNDIVIDFEGQLFGQQMIVELTAGSIYQDALGGEGPPNPAFFPVAPSLEADSYVTIGAVGSNSDQLIIGGSTELGSADPKQFDDAGANIAWAPAPGVVVDGGTDFTIARLTLSDDAQGAVFMFSNAAGNGIIVEPAGTIVDGVASFGVPEPSTCILAGLALVGFAARRNG